MGHYTPEEEKFRSKLREALKEDVVPYTEDIEEGKIEICEGMRRFAKRGYLGVMKGMPAGFSTFWHRINKEVFRWTLT